MDVRDDPAAAAARPAITDEAAAPGPKPTGAAIPGDQDSVPHARELPSAADADFSERASALLNDSTRPLTTEELKSLSTEIDAWRGDGYEEMGARLDNQLLKRAGIFKESERPVEKPKDDALAIAGFYTEHFLVRIREGLSAAQTAIAKFVLEHWNERHKGALEGRLSKRVASTEADDTRIQRYHRIQDELEAEPARSVSTYSSTSLSGADSPVADEPAEAFAHTGLIFGAVEGIVDREGGTLHAAYHDSIKSIARELAEQVPKDSELHDSELYKSVLSQVTSEYPGAEGKASRDQIMEDISESYDNQRSPSGGRRKVRFAV